MPNEKALSLFFPKGEADVIEKMTSVIKNALSAKDSEFRKWFAEEFELKEERVESLMSGNNHVDFPFFEKVKEALDISIHDVLGKPSFRDGEKGHWIEQMKLNPMVLGAPAGKSNTENSIQEENHTTKDMELFFYVRLRAISELLGNK